MPFFTPLSSPFRVDFDQLAVTRAVSDDEDREMVARHVLAVVASFTFEDDLACAAAGSDPLTAHGDDLPPAVAIERMVRQRARDAESHTIGSDVVCQVLDRTALLSDYLRIKDVEQHTAFGDAYTDAERDDHLRMLEERAAAARARAEDAARAARQRARLCRCGYTQGKHPGRYGVDGPCSTFADIADRPLAHLASRLIPDALAAHLSVHDVTLTDQQTHDACALLTDMRNVRANEVSVSEAVGAVLVALVDR